MSLLPEISQASAEINKLVAQANIHQTIAPVDPAAFTDPADTLLLASRDPVIREVSVGMTGVEAVQNTVSGTPPLSLPNTLGKPLKAWSVDVLPYQEGTGDPAPDNVRPIHGTDKLTITTAGKSLLGSRENKTIVVTSANSSFTFEKDSTRFTFITSGLSAPLGYRFNSIDLECTLPAGTYYFSSNISNQTAPDGLFVFNVGTSAVLARARLEGGSSFTLSETTTIRLGASLGLSTVSGTYWFQLESGSTATPYTPYLAPSQTVLTLPQTVYTGTIGSDGGESRSAIYVDNGSGTWTKNANTEVDGSCRFEHTLTERSSWSNSNLPAEGAMCETLKCLGTGQIYGGNDNTFGLYNTRIYVRIAGITEVSDLLAYFATQPLKVVYPCVTSTEFPLTAPPIPTPTGTASTWAAAEDGTVDGMEVTYVGKA